MLDELDSGLDIDALGVVARRSPRAVREAHPELGVLAITHYRRGCWRSSCPTCVHLLDGRACHGVATGGPELARHLIEVEGYEGWR